ncbi:Glutaredoxin-like [Candidatus Nanopelagicaceae bacterium]
MVAVTVYSRQGCHLCEIAEKTINSIREELRKDLEFSVNVLYIDGNDELEKLYGTEVPVIHINGEHHDFYKVDPERFKISLEKYRQHQ